MACAICGGTFSEYVGYPGSGTGARPLPFDRIGLCARCGSGTALPGLDQSALDSYYASGSYWTSTHETHQLVHAASQARIRLSACLPFVENGLRLQIADIGSGHGFIAREAAKSGLNVVGYDFIEPDDNAAARLEYLGLPFPVRRIGSIDQLDSKPGLVFLNQVLEHVADPHAFLKQIISNVLPGSVVHVETPNSDYRFKTDVFPHTLFFSTRSFEFLGKRLSVETLLCESFGLWPAPKFTPRGSAQRLATRALSACGRLGLDGTARQLDRFIWRYDRIGLDSCIWLRWIFRVGKQP